MRRPLPKLVEPPAGLLRGNPIIPRETHNDEIASAPRRFSVVVSAAHPLARQLAEKFEQAEAFGLVSNEPDFPAGVRWRVVDLSHIAEGALVKTVFELQVEE